MSRLSAKTSFSKDELTDRIQGCIFGAALGNAFGFQTYLRGTEKIRHAFEFGPIKFGLAKKTEATQKNLVDFTGDTDQLLIILQSLLANKGVLDPANFAFRLHHWSLNGFPELGKPPRELGLTVHSVIRHGEFLKHPHKSAYEVWNGKKRVLAANGAVMRTAVTGIPFFWNEVQVTENALSAAKVTHADPRSYVSALVVSILVSRTLSGESRKTSKIPVANDRARLIEVCLQGTEYHMKTAKPDPVPNLESNLFQTEIEYNNGFFKKFLKYTKTKNCNALANTSCNQIFVADPEMEEICRQVFQDYKFLFEQNPFYKRQKKPWFEEMKSHCFPKSLADLKLNDSRRVGYTFKCLGAAVYAFTRLQKRKVSSAEFFKALIAELAQEGGDADTNCAVAGALLGTRIGKRGLPTEWLSSLENCEFLEQISMELCYMVMEEAKI